MSHIDTLDRILAGAEKMGTIARFLEAPASPLDAIKHHLIVGAVWPGKARQLAEEAALTAFAKLRPESRDAAMLVLQWYHAHAQGSRLKFDAAAVSAAVAHAAEMPKVPAPAVSMPASKGRWERLVALYEKGLKLWRVAVTVATVWAKLRLRLR